MRLYHAHYYGSYDDPASWIGLEKAMQQCGLNRIGRSTGLCPMQSRRRAVLVNIAGQ